MRRLRVLTVLAVMVPFGLIAVPSATGAAHVSSAKQPIETTVTADPVRLVSSTGQKLYFEIEAEADTFHNEPPGVSADIFVWNGNGGLLGEEHDWEWDDIANGDLLYDSTSGTGSFETDTQLGSWGSIELTVAPTSKRPHNYCGGADQDWSVTLSGTVWFNTHTAWGAFGTKQAPLNFSEPADAEADFTGKALNGCGQPDPQQHCNGSIDWDDSGGLHGGVDGNSVGHNGKRGGQLYFSDIHSLEGGLGPIRSDTVFVSTAKPPKIVSTDKGKVTSLHVHAGTHGPITGSATLTGKGRPTIKKHECAGGTTQEWNASYRPGPNPLTVHMAVGGDFTHRAEKSGAFFSIESH
jgi:hypothetical protein